MREALFSAAALCALVTLLPGAVTWKVGTAPSPPSRTELRKMMAAGEMVNGVKPWKLGDTDEYVIVLRLEGANFPAVRKRFGFKADPQNRPPYISEEEVAALFWAAPDTAAWVVAAPSGAAERRVEPAPPGAVPRHGKAGAGIMLALKAEGVVWAAHDLPQLFAQHVESETVRKLNLKGQRAYREAKVAACRELTAGQRAKCERDMDTVLESAGIENAVQEGRRMSGAGDDPGESGRLRL
jgi:hypothetical protein